MTKKRQKVCDIRIRIIYVYDHNDTKNHYSKINALDGLQTALIKIPVYYFHTIIKILATKTTIRSWIFSDLVWKLSFN